MSSHIKNHRKLLYRLWVASIVLWVGAVGMILAVRIPGWVLQRTGFVPQGNLEDVLQYLQQLTPPSNSLEEFAAVPDAVGITPDTLPAGETAAAGDIQPGSEDGLEYVAREPAYATLSSPADDGETSPNDIISGYAALFIQSETPDTIHVTVDDVFDLTLGAADTFATTLWVGQDTAGLPLGIVQYEESGVITLCASRTDNCENEYFHIEFIDFRPDSLIAYGSVRVGSVWLEGLGVAMRLGYDGRSFIPLGLIWGDELYGFPPEGELSEVIEGSFERLNSALAHLQIEADAYVFTLDEIRVTDDYLILILR